MKELPKIKLRIHTRHDSVVRLDNFLYIGINKIIERVQVLLDKPSYLQFHVNNGIVK